MTDKRAIRIGEVCGITGLSRSTIWRLVKAQQFPAPIKLGQRAVGWIFGDVTGWLESRRAH